jgi:hypothetical protein
MDKDLALEILESHFKKLKWKILETGIEGEYSLGKNKDENYSIDLVFNDNIIKLSKMVYSNYYEDGEFAGIKVNIITDTCETYDELYESIKELTE